MVKQSRQNDPYSQSFCPVPQAPNETPALIMQASATMMAQFQNHDRLTSNPGDTVQCYFRTTWPVRIKHKNCPCSLVQNQKNWMIINAHHNQ